MTNNEEQATITDSKRSAWIDVSVPLYFGMVHWPDNPPVKIELANSIERGDTANVSSISMGAHTGTHMDAPYHFLESGKTIDQMPLEVGLGYCRVIEITDPGAITAAELTQFEIRAGERVLFKTANSRRCWNTHDFVQDYVGVAPDAARHLVESQVRLIGVDYLSVGPYGPLNPETHRTLLKAGVWIIEGLNLSALHPGRYELICLPLRIRHGDGAPARAIVRSI
jgi:arylformamidase